MTKRIVCNFAPKLIPWVQKRKRIKIALGGRGGSKSVAVAQAVLHRAYFGARIACIREFQNSIDNSVYPLLCRTIVELGLQDEFLVRDTYIEHPASGGYIFFAGVARNIDSIKGFDNVDVAWFEEAAKASAESLQKLPPSIRKSGSEIWYTLNRENSQDPFSLRYLSAIEDELANNNGVYEDDFMSVLEINYYDNPAFPAELEMERARDQALLPPNEYAHIWLGKYRDSVPNAIIQPDWFDACIDAHTKLNFGRGGVEVVTFDPADSGDDKAICYREGNIIRRVDVMSAGLVNDAADWATDIALDFKPDWFVWDVGGIGAGLRRQISQALGPKKIALFEFNNAGEVDQPDSIYDRVDSYIQGANKTNKEAFENLRAQKYWELRNRIIDTFLAVTRGDAIDKDRLISFDSAMGTSDLAKLRSELCSIPKVPNKAQKIQLMSKKDMKEKLKIPSPNRADAVVMAFNSRFQPVGAVNASAWNQLNSNRGPSYAR